MKKSVQKILVSLFLFFIVFLTFIMLCPSWAFDGEDFGVIYRVSHIKSIKDFIDLLIHGNLSGLAGDYLTQTIHSDMPIYRPIILIFTYFQYYFFNMQAYGYFIITILLQAIISVLFFFILTEFIDVMLAFLFALFFAFHPQLWCWIGKIDTQQHQISLLFAALLFIALKKLLLTNNSIWLYILSSFLFLLCLLSRETFIVLPLMTFLFLHFFSTLQKRNKLKILLCLCVPALLYLFMRQIAYPINIGVLNIFTANPTSASFNLKNKILSLGSWLYGLYGYFLTTFIPWSTYYFFKALDLDWFYRLIKVFLLVIVPLLFFTNAKKKIIIYLLFCTILLHWPLLFLSYGGTRYFYEPSPFFIAALAFLTYFSSLRQSKLFRIIWFSFLILLIPINAYFVIQNRNIMTSEAILRYKSITTLKKELNNKLQDKFLFFINLPNQNGFSWIGILQASNLYTISSTGFGYIYRFLEIHPKITDAKRFLKIYVRNDTIRFISQDKKKLWLKKPNVLKDLKINESTDDKIFDLSITFKPNYITKNIAFITWDYLNDKFLVINPVISQ